MSSHSNKLNDYEMFGGPHSDSTPNSADPEADVSSGTTGVVLSHGRRVPTSVMLRCLYYLEPHDLRSVALTSRAMSELAKSVSLALRLRQERTIALRDVQQAFETAGYRKGIEEMEDRLLQHGFNEGFIASSASHVQVGVQRGIATALSLYLLKKYQDVKELPHVNGNRLTKHEPATFSSTFEETDIEYFEAKKEREETKGYDKEQKEVHPKKQAHCVAENRSGKSQLLSYLIDRHPQILSRLQLLNQRLNALAKELDFPANQCTIHENMLDFQDVRNSRVGVPMFEVNQKPTMVGARIDSRAASQSNLDDFSSTSKDTNLKIRAAEIELEKEDGHEDEDRAVSIRPQRTGLKTKTAQESGGQVGLKENSNTEPKSIDPIWRQDINPERFDGIVLSQRFQKIAEGEITKSAAIPIAWQEELISVTKAINEVVCEVVRKGPRVNDGHLLKVEIQNPFDLIRVWLVRAAAELKSLEMKAKGIYIDAALNNTFPPANPGLLGQVRIGITAEEMGYSSDKEDDYESLRNITSVDPEEEKPSLEGIDFM